MRKRIQIFGVSVEVDAERTMAYYNSIPTVADKEHCGCSSCRNYVKASGNFPRAVLQVFEAFGIDPRKECEVSPCVENSNGLYFYTGFYHFVGAIQGVNESDWYRVENFAFAVTNASEDSAGVADDFPTPVVELSFQVDLPWVLDESP